MLQRSRIHPVAKCTIFLPGSQKNLGILSLNTYLTPKKLLDRVRDALRLKHYSIHTEQAYVNWLKYYILFCYERYLKQWEWLKLKPLRRILLWNVIAP